MKEEQVRGLLDFLARHPARLEPLVAELVHQGLIELDEIEFRALSTFARNYSPDIALAEIVPGGAGPALRLSTHREGLYDQLPYALFHRPETYYPGQGLDSRLEEAAAARERETHARNFFFPLEQEYFLTAIKTELSERRLTDVFTSPLRRRLLLEVWPRCARLHEDVLPLLSYILPLSWRIAGDLDLMTVSFRAALRVHVHLRYVEQEPHDRAPVGMGDRLGTDFGLSGAPETDMPVLEIRIGPLEKRRAAEFRPEAAGRQLLGLLCECLVPYEVDVTTVFLYEPTDAALTLGRGRPDDSRLGLTSVLTTTPAPAPAGS